VYLCNFEHRVEFVDFLPASWLAVGLEQQTDGRFSLGDVQGSFWQGSAFLGAAKDRHSALTPLFPGRFVWKISPLIVFGQIDVALENTQVISKTVHLTGNLSQFRLSAASIVLPPERLEGFGAPLNTIGPSGKIKLKWNELEFTRHEARLDMQGLMQLMMTEMGSRLSSIKPLGSYQLDLNWHGQNAEIKLQSSKGPLLLSGAGTLKNGHLQFSGKAMADDGQDEKLANLLNLLGQRRFDGNKNVIALEFK